MMLWIYIKIAFRILFKDKFFSLINIVGLAIGISSFLLIALYLKFEWEYDTFYKDYEQIYRVNTVGGITSVDDSSARCPIFVSAEVKNYSPDLVESASMIYDIWGSIIETKHKSEYEYNIYFSNSSFFDVFGIESVAGDLTTALNNPNSVVITEAMKQKYFGEEDALGKEIKLDVLDSSCIVTAVIKDIPQNSHVIYDILVSYNSYNYNMEDAQWLYANSYNYVKLKKGVKPTELDSAFAKVIKEKISPVMVKYFNVSAEEYMKADEFYFYLEPLKELHLFSEVMNNPFGTSHFKYFYLFGVAGILLLILTGLNYINLSIARAIKRIRTIALRKASGADRGQLLLQFLTESMLMSLFAIILSLSFLEFMLPYFNEISGKEFGNYLTENPSVVVFIILGGVLLGAILGLYPALYLSSVPMVKSVGMHSGFSGRRGGMRKSFVGLQFIISFVIIISSVIVYKQLQYIYTADIALEKEKIIVLSSAYMIGEKRKEFKKELLKNEDIDAVSFSSIYPGPDFNFTELVVRHKDTSHIYTFSTLIGDFDLDKIFGFSVSKGRLPADTVEGDSIAVVINETAVKKYKFKDPLNCYIELLNYHDINHIDTLWVKVVGVVNDFHYENLHKEIGPLFIGKLSNRGARFLLIKTKDEVSDETRKYVHKIWNQFTGDKFFQARAMSYNWAEHYREEKRTADILLFFSSITILIACIGLIGIVLYTLNSRTREIGIRKALGATNVVLLKMLIKEHIVILFTALLIAIPSAYFTVYAWLSSFAYRIELTPVYFTLPSLLLSILVISVVVAVAEINIREEVADAIRYE